jgi:hypothetical protein
MPSSRLPAEPRRRSKCGAAFTAPAAQQFGTSAPGVAMNEVNLGAPVTTIGLATTGSISSAGDPRQMQIALRFVVLTSLPASLPFSFEFAINVRPELFQDVGGRVDSQLESKLGDRVLS